MTVPAVPQIETRCHHDKQIQPAGLPYHQKHAECYAASAYYWPASWALTEEWNLVVVSQLCAENVSMNWMILYAGETRTATLVAVHSYQGPEHSKHKIKVSTIRYAIETYFKQSKVKNIYKSPYFLDYMMNGI